MTKKMSAIFVAIMLFAQIGIAQHNAVHFSGHGDHAHYEHSHDEHKHGDNDQDQKKNFSEACQTCLLAKSLSLGLVSYHADLPARVLSKEDFFKSHGRIVINHKRALYNPRAPPFFLI